MSYFPLPHQLPGIIFRPTPPHTYTQPSSNLMVCFGAGTQIMAVWHLLFLLPGTLASSSLVMSSGFPDMSHRVCAPQACGSVLRLTCLLAQPSSFCVWSGAWDSQDRGRAFMSACPVVGAVLGTWQGINRCVFRWRAWRHLHV